MTEDPSVRVGVVGCGNIGHHHAERVSRSGGTLAGGVDPDRTARDRFADKFDVPVYQDHGALYEDADAVVVATPNRYHAENVIDALEAGLDVLVEKPVAHTLAAAERIRLATQDADGFCMVGFHTRFENEVEVLRAYRDAGRFGELTHVEANYLRRRGIPGRGSWFTRDDTSGGGALIDIGVHAVDLALYMLGYPEVEEVTGVTRSQFGGRDDYSYLHMWGEDQGPEGFDVDDSVTALVRCAGNRTVALEAAWAANRPSKQEYVFRGTEGGATYDRSVGEVTLHETSATGAVHNADTDVDTAENDAHAAELAYFLEHVAEGTEPERNTVDEALTVQRVLDAVYESSASGSSVSL